MHRFPKKNADKNGPVTIGRRTEQELERAITDLEKRNYILISRGIKNYMDQSFQQKRTDRLTANLRANRPRLLDPVDAVKYYAIMQKLSC